jgi:shikimate dehydrogenase
MGVLGLDWCYVACEVAPERLKEALEGARAMRWMGVNLTVPHKLLAMPLMDELDESARLWGAVNTVVFEVEDDEGLWRPVGQVREGVGGVLRSKGYNTDADAIVRSIRDDLAIEPRGARVLLLGVGGAGRTAALRLADEGIGELWLVNRTESKAVELARELEERFPAVHIGVGYPESDVEIVLNATSLGLKSGDGLPLDTSKFNLGACVHGVRHDLSSGGDALFEGGARGGMPGCQRIGNAVVSGCGGTGALDGASGTPWRP